MQGGRRNGEDRERPDGKVQLFRNVRHLMVSLLLQVACGLGRRRDLGRLRARVFDATLLRKHGTRVVQSALLVGNLQLLQGRQSDRASFTRARPV